MNEQQFSPEYIEMVERLDSGDPPETSAKEPRKNGCERRLVSLCESCRFMQPDFPTMEDPLACPFCTKGRWSGFIVEAPPEDDPWKDCPDFEDNSVLPEPPENNTPA